MRKATPTKATRKRPAKKAPDSTKLKKPVSQKAAIKKTPTKSLLKESLANKHPSTKAVTKKVAKPPTPARTKFIIGIRDRVFAIVKSWAKLSTYPVGSDSLQVLWAASSPGTSFADGAEILSQKINAAFTSSLRASDFNPPDKITTVDDLVEAIP
jgi:hypothetical protein